MKYNNLYDLITYLQYGTKLHIGVLFFGNYGNEKCILPQKQTIHAGKICDEFKSRRNGLKRCFRCRNAAIKKARETKEAFGGFCINGVYEYTRPVLLGGNLVCMIYIGNILEKTKGYDKLKTEIEGKEWLFDSMEEDFTFEKCETVAELIESYILILIEKFSSKDLKKFNPLIENIKNYIEENLEYDMKISAIAKAFGYNEQYLGRIFKRETKMSITEYMNTRRIEKAKLLLKETCDSVINISGSVGFNNVTYFNRLFKKKTNKTPIEFRAD